MALGLSGSLAIAASSQAVKSRSGSSASVKSPDVNQVGCSIGAVSDICSEYPMAAFQAGRASRRSPYSGTASARLRPLVGAAAFTLALSCGGSGVSGQFGSLFGSDRDDSHNAYAKAETTGTVSPPGEPASPGPQAGKPALMSKAGLPPEADLFFTRAAVAEVLARGGQAASAAWENPRPGARGTVTPIAAAYDQNGATCRDFLASYLRAGSEAWLQGEACRESGGRWEVKSLRPWKRT